MSEEENKQKPIRNVRFKEDDESQASDVNKENTNEINHAKYESK